MYTIPKTFLPLLVNYFYIYIKLYGEFSLNYELLLHDLC